ncbi:MAG: 2-C-methyl-D-erythritol 4-phosphate cytidylyltransferase [Cyclobacteriaceae bacterium]
MEKFAIIVAGGKGLRMGSPTPKQFLEIDSKPIIARSVERFFEYEKALNIIVVIPQDQVQAWQGIAKKFFPKETITLAIGGATRFESVKSGLDKILSDGLVAIHDAVRPYVSAETISQSFLSAEKHGSGVASVELKDSIREISDQGSTARNRADYRLVQTPQTFRVSEIKAAFESAQGTNFLDDASVYEAAGHSVKLIAGSYENIKITTPDDLK